ncbi:MAG: ParB/RepB/Spo0J family partition protein [Syntrophobacterales bacterium]|jgi:ParB-like chromosome segregation protein Spo0J
MHEKESYSIQLDEVDWNDTSCLITYGPLPDTLTLAIQTVGLIQKPLLQRKRGGRLRIVCGSRRLAVCKQLGLEPLSGDVLSASTPPETCLRMAIYDNITHRDLNPVEKSLVLTKMAQHLNQAQLIQEFMPLLNQEPNAALFRRYERLSSLEESILDAIAGGTLHERIGFALSPLKPGDRLAFFNLFQELPFSVSVQEELVTTVVEIGQRDNLTPRQILNSEEVNNLRRAPKRPARQRAQEIRKQLLATRAPRLTARKERFYREVGKLGLPSGVRLIPPPYFEGPKWTLECAFERGDELAVRLRQLAELADQPEFQHTMESDG